MFEITYVLDNEKLVTKHGSRNSVFQFVIEVCVILWDTHFNGIASEGIPPYGTRWVILTESGVKCQVSAVS